MKRARSILALALACAVVPGAPRSAGADAPKPLDYKAYDAWNAIRTPKLSDDGKRLAYALTPEDGDPTLVVRDLDGTAERREPRGSAPAFAGDGRFVVYTHVAAKKDVDAAKKAKKPEAEQPKNGVGILDLTSTAPPEIVDDVKTIAVAKNGGPAIAYLAEPSPSPSASALASAAPATPEAKLTAPPRGEPSPRPRASIAPAPSASTAAPSASASPSASPAPKADKTKDTGAPLTIRDLVAGTHLVAPDATSVVVADDDAAIAYATETKNGKGDGVHVYDVAHGTTLDFTQGAGRYRGLALARDGSSLAYLSDAATYANDVPHDALYVVDLRAAKPVAHDVADLGTAGMPRTATPSANGKVTFSKDGRRVFFGTAAAPTPLPSGTPEPMKVDEWAWNDDVLQSQQKKDADEERKRTYLAVYDVVHGRFAQLGSPAMRNVVRNENPDTVLGEDDRAYRRAASWRGEIYEDLYSVSLATGARREIARAASSNVYFSPGGKYVAVWDERSAHWIAIRLRDRHPVTLAPRARVAFYDVEDDHPDPPQPEGFGGWLAGDRGVLIYDRYDVWRADPDTGAASSLTRGAGARTRTVYSPVSTDPDADAFPLDKPLLLTLIDTRTYASGYASVPVSGGVPATLFEKNEIVNGTRDVFEAPLHDLGFPPLAAKHGDRYVFSRETFREFRNLWATDTRFRQPRQVTDANPQLARYRWGTEHLISYKGADGTPLRAVMLIPDGLRRDRKAPMLVYFYERWSDMFHEFYSPAPGTSPNFARYVSNGYVVLFPDVKYRVGHPGASALNCVLPAVDAALKSGYADPKRVGMAGHSWAAYQINYMIAKTHRFRAVEAGAAVDDMISAYGGIRLESGIVRESQYEHTQSRIGATPWDRPDLYLENSGLFGIRNVTTPYLTIHNDADGAVPQFQGIEYITAMRRLGKTAYLFSFDGEDHNLKGREQQKWWTVHLDQWFDYWLKGAPRPAWMNGVPYLHRGETDVHPLYGEPG
ncbi:MAG TPA: prolyl oligopeptidase family serine peptidase [Candidatus Baltobacteraceae bacterium]|nr:prolyl oligopeptidase family serine peptidase [Candidatus Baltobacteraceae bacterium]